jgi:branched-subunit amino acid ABC-type transport system permease component
LIDFINFYLFPGLVLGSIYALGALGVSLVFGVLRFAHFAHGDMMTLGAYFSLTLVFALSGMPAADLSPAIRPWLGLPIAIVGTGLVCIVIDKVFYRPLRDRPTVIILIASFGIALMVRSAVQLIWTPLPQSYTRGIQRPTILDLGFDEPLRFLARHLYMMLVVVILIVLVHYFLTRTRHGKAMRALSDDPDLAKISGIDTERITTWMWVIGGGLAGAAGVLIGIDTEVHTMMGWNVLLPVFAAAILGGIGKPYGAIAGGLVIGFAEEMSAYPLIGDEPLLEPTYKSAVAFAIMVAMLLWRPSGLFRGRVY